LERVCGGAGLLPSPRRVAGAAELLQPLVGRAADAGDGVERRPAAPVRHALAADEAAGDALMAARRQSERGSAMVEAAIIFPCLVLILYWSAALTDVMVLKLKAAEALRYSLWEMTVFKPPAQINNEVQQRFVDLRSPKSINISYTG